MWKALTKNCLLCLLYACNSSTNTLDKPSKKPDDSSVIENTLSREHSQLPDSVMHSVGDFDGDNIPDSAWVVPPFQNINGWCEECITKVAFTNKIDSLEIPFDANGAQLFNVGDLDGNSSDEILLIPDWMHSCWGKQYVYTHKNHSWDTLVSEQVFRCNIYNRVIQVKHGVFDLVIDTGPGGSGNFKRRIKIQN